MYPDDLPRRSKLDILCEQQGHSCCYCGVRFTDEMPDDLRLYQDPRPSVEHVIRIADGGQKAWDNEVAACRGCNSCRGEIEAGAFYELVRHGDLPGLRNALRTSLSAKRRSRGALRLLGPSYRIAARKGKWPPSLGELPMTEGRKEYFELVYGPWAGTVRVSESKPAKSPKGDKKLLPKRIEDDPRFVNVAGIWAARWDVKNLPGP